MTVTIRASNNPAYATAVMEAIKKVCVGYPTPNTALAAASESQTGLERVFIRSDNHMFDSGVMPAVLLHSGVQNYERSSHRTFQGLMTIYLDYYDRLTQTTKPIDDIRDGILADLDLMKSNIEANDSLTIGATIHTVSLPTSEISDDRGTKETRNDIEYVYIRLTMNFNVLPYDTF